MAARAKDDKLFGRLTALRRHLVKCTQCRDARSALNVDHMCLDGKGLTLAAADEFDIIIELKRRMRELGDGVFYPCPDPAAHGRSHAMTVRPYHAVAVQDGLW